MTQEFEPRHVELLFKAMLPGVSMSLTRQHQHKQNKPAWKKRLPDPPVRARLYTLGRKSCVTVVLPYLGRSELVRLLWRQSALPVWTETV